MQKRVEKLLWKCKMICNLVQSHRKQKQPKLKGVPCRKPRELQKLLQKVQELILCIFVIPWETIVYCFHCFLILWTYSLHLISFIYLFIYLFSVWRNRFASIELFTYFPRGKVIKYSKHQLNVDLPFLPK